MKKGTQFPQDQLRQWESRTFVSFSIRTYWRFVRLSVGLLAGNRDDLSPSFIKLASRIQYLINHSGYSFTVSYLKECFRLVSKTVAGDLAKPSEDGLRVGMRRGLPLIIPGDLRLLIEAKDPVIIKLTLTILSVFRVMPSFPKLKLETITSPFNGISESVPEISWVVQWLEKLTSGNRGGDYFGQAKVPYTVGRKLLRLTSAGPNHKLQLCGYCLDALAFKENPELLKGYKVFAMNTNHRDLWERLGDDMKHGDSNSVLTPYHGDGKQTTEGLKSQGNFASPTSSLKLGRLALKMEAAGKVRVFAIVDAWTQSLLSPLHRALFSLLKQIPQDGTFDQLAPVMKLHERKLKEMFSFDLSAATDRLPIALQTDILALLFKNRETAEAGRNLLIDRDYHLSDKRFPLANGRYRYAVGQPMGALSSWAMLALTHHLLVQVAALRVGGTTGFSDYAVLGDDIVIANKSVAQSYQFLMKYLGLEINLSKSLISDKGGCEFAKKIIVEGQDLSPLGVKELFQLLGLPRRLKDVIMNYNIHDRIFDDGVTPASVSEILCDFISRAEDFANPKGISRAKAMIGDIIGFMGLSLTKGLSPILNDQAIDSLSSEEQEILKSLLVEELKSRVARGWLDAFEKDVKVYNKLRRKLMEYTFLYFPSGDHLLGQYAEDLHESSRRPFKDIDLLSLEELLEKAFLDQGRLTDPFVKPKASSYSKSKSLDLSRSLLIRLLQTSPHLYLKVLRNSQASYRPE